MTKHPQAVVNLVNFELGRLLSESARIRDQLTAGERQDKQMRQALDFNNQKIRELKRFLGEAPEDDGA